MQVIRNLKLNIVSCPEFLKGYSCPCAHGEGMWSGRDTAALILNHGTRLMWVMGFTLWLHYPERKSPL
jgi:hypothetical protein